MSIPKIAKDKTYATIVTGYKRDPFDTLFEKIVERLNTVIQKVNELEEKIGE